MADREKVILDIERCISHVPDACIDCSHYHGVNGIGCMEDLLTHAYDLLKEQDAQSVLSNRVCKVEPFRYVRKGFCPKCHQEMEWLLNRKYCGFCGQAVKWELRLPKR